MAKSMRSKQEVIDNLCSKPGLRGRIDAACVHCIYDDTPDLGIGNWRMQVQNCTVTSCPLHEVRAKSESLRIAGEKGQP